MAIQLVIVGCPENVSAPFDSREAQTGVSTTQFCVHAESEIVITPDRGYNYPAAHCSLRENNKCPLLPRKER